ncbi:Acyl-[acyl-carrier-protein]--UDP-N-acetylglucosamine O-acyltransferase [hydrothermal vent metagenome]|uniref:Acyl-[acyl-carrier-protein]--UDP-N-acetylglucosamine O-acyltransferase n=1 Tax=hydrothermal vent metagenome TaxID=652676 RepID=A0A1W1EL08_9ZZZZ
MQNIHKSSIIEDGAIIGKNVTIAPFCYIGKDVTIGDNTTIGANTLIEGNTTIGKNNRIFSNVVLGSIPQDLKFKNERVELIIGDNNIFREFSFITPGTLDGGSVTKLRDNNLIMAYVHLGHDVIMGSGCILSNATNVGGHVEFGDGVIVGAMSAIHQFVKIGDKAMIAGASALTQDLPPYCMAEGNRAILRGLNITGLRRAFKRDDIDKIKHTYKELFESGKPLKDSANRILENSDNNYVRNLCNFVIDTKRGIPYARNGINAKKM